MTAENNRTSAKYFWNSRSALRYPLSVETDFGAVMFADAYNARIAIGKWIEDNSWLPEKGSILDLGAGPCSHLVFGEQITRQRVTAVDWAQLQLGASLAFKKRVMDLREPSFPRSWNNSFHLITSFYLSRYLYPEERFQLYQSILPLLRNKTRLLIVDTQKVSSMLPQVAETLGEVCTFNHQEEAELIEQTGFRNIEHGIVNISFQAFAKILATQTQFVTAVK